MLTILKELGIDNYGTTSSNGMYVVDFESSDEFGKAFSKLDRNDDVEYLSDISSLNVSTSNLAYNYKDHRINLIADFDNDTYKLVII